MKEKFDFEDHYQNTKSSTTARTQGDSIPIGPTGPVAKQRCPVPGRLARQSLSYPSFLSRMQYRTVIAGGPSSG